MARPTKTGLDYFPVDTEWDIKIKLVKAKFGLNGVGCIIELYKLIYSEGYAVKWDEDTCLLFCASNGIDNQTLTDIVVFSTDKGVFSRGLLERYGVLTSRGIQKRWLKIAKESGRTIKNIEKEINLLTDESFPIPETRLSVQETTQGEVLSIPETTQSKVKESKVKESKEERASAPPIFTFETFSKSVADFWNGLKVSPAFRFTTSANLASKEREGFSVAMDRYTMDEIKQSIQNYAEITQSPDYNPFPKGYGLPGFLVSGVGQYLSDADPWSRCKKPAEELNAGLDEKTKAAILAELAAEKAASEKPAPTAPPIPDDDRGFDDDDGFYDEPAFVFDAKAEMQKIRHNAGLREERVV